MNKPSLEQTIISWRMDLRVNLDHFFEIYIFSKAKAIKFRIVVSSSGAADSYRVCIRFHLYVNSLPLCTDHQRRLRCSKFRGKNSETSFIPLLWSVCVCVCVCGGGSLRNNVRVYIYTYIYGDRGGTVVRCCATNRKVVGSIPDGIIGIFH